MSERTKKCIKIIMICLYVVLIINCIGTIQETSKLYEIAPEIYEAGKNNGISSAMAILLSYDLVVMTIKKLKERKKASE